MLYPIEICSRGRFTLAQTGLTFSQTMIKHGNMSVNDLTMIPKNARHTSNISKPGRGLLPLKLGFTYCSILCFEAWAF